jgi:ABC-type uncharacterized transport system fused permease/ATPase subunit
MKNTVILEKQDKVYLVVETQMREEPVHSAWSTKEDAEEIAEILNQEDYSTAIVQEVLLDTRTPIGIGYQILMNLNTGELVSDDIVNSDRRCVIWEENPSAHQHNFVMFEDPNRCLIKGSYPHLIKDKWMVNETELSWEEFLNQPFHERYLDECTVFAMAFTKEEAIQLAQEKCEELKLELERRHGISRSSSQS